MVKPPVALWSAAFALALGAALTCPLAYAGSATAQDANETEILEVVEEEGGSAEIGDDESQISQDDTSSSDGGDNPESSNDAVHDDADGSDNLTDTDAANTIGSSDSNQASDTESANSSENASSTSDNVGNPASDTAPATTLASSEQASDSAVTQEADATQYAHSDSATDAASGVSIKVEWNDPVLGEPTTFHVSGTGGSGTYRFRMDAPAYASPGIQQYESVADPSRGEWMNYTNECESHDYTFTMTATGTYNFRFYLMDTASGVGYLRSNTYITVSDDAYPSVASIVSTAVAQCNAETNGSDYEQALWLHDWLLEQLEYDNSLKWSSAESALTRGLGTCQAYESAYAKLLKAAGIENAETRDTYDGHTWNAVKMDGTWYQVDCTWDDTNDHWYDFDQRHLYFGLTDELMAIAHPGHMQIYTAADYSTRSTSLADNYFVRSGQASRWEEAYSERIQQYLNSNKKDFAVTADNITDPPSIYSIVNGVTAYQIEQSNWANASGPVALNVSYVGTTFYFTASYANAGDTLEVSDYKHGSDDTSTWTAPQRDGYAFAGWYADEACTQTYIGTSGQAYARFAPVSELVRPTGCSLRDDGKGADVATLRFCYEFTVPSGATRTAAGWHARNTKTGGEKDVPLVNYWLAGGDSILANLAFTGVERDGSLTSFASAYEVSATLSYATADGTPVTVAEASPQSQSVQGAAAALVSGGIGSPDADKAYAKSILGEANPGVATANRLGYTALSLSVYDYKHGSTTPSQWTYPSLDGYAFAGWYSDASCSQPYTRPYGYAYARFAPVSELVRPTGCSLRDDGKGADVATLRFCYEFTVPSGATRTAAGWHARNTKTGGEKDVPLVNYWLAGGDSILANLAFTGVERDGSLTSFASAYEVSATLSYATADGTPVTVAEASPQSQSVQGAAAALVSGGIGSPTDIEHARAILSAI